MSLRIGCDLDGTLADMDGALQRHAQTLFGPDVTLAGLTDAQRRRLWNHVAKIEDFWLTLDEIEPGTVATLAQHAASHGWQILFLTQRPACPGDTVQRQTQKWLEACGFDLPSVYPTCGSRGRVASALSLDVVLDDRPDNCLDVATDSKAHPLLIWRYGPRALPPGAPQLGIEVVSSMAEGLEVLQRLSARRTPTLVGRVRAALGL